MNTKTTKIKRKSVTIKLPEEAADFLMSYCRNEEMTERATWIANLVIREVKKIQQEQQATAPQ